MLHPSSLCIYSSISKSTKCAPFPLIPLHILTSLSRTEKVKELGRFLLCSCRLLDRLDGLFLQMKYKVKTIPNHINHCQEEAD